MGTKRIKNNRPDKKNKSLQTDEGHQKDYNMRNNDINFEIDKTEMVAIDEEIDDSEEALVKSNIDLVFSSLGNIGTYQRKLYALSCLPIFICGCISFSHVFTTAIPEKRCFIEQCEDDKWEPKSIKELFNQTHLKFSIPSNADYNQNKTTQYLTCEKFQNLDPNQCKEEAFDKKFSVDCGDSYVYNHEYFCTSIVTDFKLFCSKEWMVRFLAQSAFFFGVAIGSPINGIIADKFGRLIMFKVYAPVTLIAEIVSSLASNIYVYSGCSVVKGISCSSLFSSAFSIGIEAIGGKWRFWLGNSYTCVFALGAVYSSLVGWIFKKWRLIEWANVLPTIPLLLYPCESIRWQFNTHQIDKALDQVICAAKINNIQLSKDLLDHIQENSASMKKREGLTVKDLFRNSVICRWTLIMFFVWFSNSLVYYALAFLSAKINRHIYLVMIALFLIEIPAVLVSSYFAFYTRQRVLIILMVACGFSLMALPFIEENSVSSITLAIIGKIGIAGSYALLYIYSAEIFPTDLRNTGLGLCSMMARVGSMISPHIMKLESIWKSLPFFTIGIISLVAGVLCFMLPETQGKKLPDRIEDVLKLQYSAEKPLKKVDSIVRYESSPSFLATNRL